MRRSTYILDDMAMVTNEEERPCILHIDLHPNES
jgi:hypothetical protein